MNLVTVVTCTYNSSNYIIETLESIARQTYENIELIISDDASYDDTILKVEGWLQQEEIKKRFVKSKILRVNKNTGVSANANRALKAASGDWIKYIGADDTLLPDCISNNVIHVKDNPNIKVLFSQVNMYINDFMETNFLYTTPDHIDNKSILWDQYDSEIQYKMLLISDRIHFTPSIFLNTDTLKSVGGFDERFKLLEDYPLWLKLTKAGYRLFFMDKITVNYRKHAKAINNTDKQFIVNPNYFKNESFRRIYTYPNLPPLIRFYQRYNWYVCQIFRINSLNKSNRFNHFLSVLLTIYLNPGRYMIWLKRKFSSSNDNIYLNN